MSNHQEGAGEARGESRDARLPTNDGLLEVIFHYRRNKKEVNLSIEVNRKALYHEGSAWSARLGPVNIFPEVVEALRRVACRIADETFTMDELVVIADEGDLAIEIQFLTADDTVILGPGKLVFYLIWSAMGVSGTCRVFGIIDITCAKELSQGLAGVK